MEIFNKWGGLPLDYLLFYLHNPVKIEDNDIQLRSGL